MKTPVFDKLDVLDVLECVANGIDIRPMPMGRCHLWVV